MSGPVGGGPMIVVARARGLASSCERPAKLAMAVSTVEQVAVAAKRRVDDSTLPRFRQAGMSGRCAETSGKT